MKVTICCAVYNRFETLQESIESMLNQDYNDFEVIIINDGSTDVRVKEYLDSLNYSNLKVYHQENSGFVASIKRAINYSAGHYIAIHGHGDVSLPSRLSRQAALLNDNDSISAVSCCYKSQLVDEDFNVAKVKDINHIKTKTLTYNDFYKGNLFSHGEVMLRKSTYDAVGGYRETFKLAQDYDLWLRMLKISNFYKLDDFLYIQRSYKFDGVKSDYVKLINQQLYADFAKQLSILPENESCILSKYGDISLLCYRISPSLYLYIIKQIIKLRIKRDFNGMNQVLELLSLNNNHMVSKCMKVIFNTNKLDFVFKKIKKFKNYE